MQKNFEILRNYVLVGNKENWEIAISQNVWGFTQKSKGLWRTTKIGENLAYYVTAPIKNIIGFGKIKNKIINNDLIWQTEKQQQESIWIYKLLLDHLYICKDWSKGIPIPNSIILQSSRKVLNDDFFLYIVKKADSQWRTKLLDKFKNN